MTLLEQIKQDQFNARKNKEALKATLLTTLYSEAQMVGKNAGRDTTDNETTLVIQKFLKGVNDTIAYLEKGGDNAQAMLVATTEKEILNSYLAPMASAEEIIEAVAGIVASGVETSKMGIIMKMLKNQFGATLDGKLAADIIKDYK